MYNQTNKAPLLGLTSLLFCLTCGSAFAHSGGGVMDPGGDSPHFTAVAVVNCHDDGNGPADHIYVRIKGTSDQANGSLINLQVYKANQAISTTDPVSGDGEYSPGVELYAGAGNYTLIANLTGPGPVPFIADWHCEAEDNTHTGTGEIFVKQFQ